MNKVAAPTDNKLGAMEENALCVCHCLFGLVSCLKCFQDRSLAEAVKERLTLGDGGDAEEDKGGRVPQQKGEYTAAQTYSNTIVLAAVVDVVLPR